MLTKSGDGEDFFTVLIHSAVFVLLGCKFLRKFKMFFLKYQSTVEFKSKLESFEFHF